MKISEWMSHKTLTPFIFACLLAAWACTGSNSRQVTSTELQGHIKYLASDSLKGRLTGSAGDSLAASYIRQQLAANGLVPVTGDGFLRYGITDKVIQGQKNFLKFDGREFTPDTDFMPTSFSGNGELESEVVFGGYGLNISNDSLKWNDYQKLDVNGKWILVLRGDPESEKSVSGFIPFSGDREKALLARDMGAAGVLMASGPVFDSSDKFDRLSASDYSVDLPVLQIRREVADLILKKTGKTVAGIESDMNKTRKSMGFPTRMTVYAGAEVLKEKSATRDVVMILPGEDPKLKDEYVIVGAHFDHLGMGGPGSSSRAGDTTAVHHGADDNASGVGELLELAEKFSLTPGSHSRSIVFAAFSGEEEGLLGSKYFADNPGIDLSRVNLMLNLDMTGRLTDSTALQIGGVGTADGLKDFVLSAIDTGLMKITFMDEGYGPSDHSSFYAKNIPVLFWSTGAHLDYHTPSDTWDKINYAGMVKISDLIFNVAEKAANSTERLKFREAGPKTDVSRTIRRRGVTLGIMPDFAGNEKNGLRADLVTPGKPAALGGMKKGDIITSINGKTVRNIQDYMIRMGQLSHGQTISVEVLRAGKKEVLLIQL